MGSPLLALHAIDPFDLYVFGERGAERASVIAARVEDTIASHGARLSLDDPAIMRAVRVPSVREVAERRERVAPSGRSYLDCELAIRCRACNAQKGVRA